MRNFRLHHRCRHTPSFSPLTHLSCTHTQPYTIDVDILPSHTPLSLTHTPLSLTHTPLSLTHTSLTHTHLSLTHTSLTHTHTSLTHTHTSLTHTHTSLTHTPLSLTHTPLSHTSLFVLHNVVIRKPFLVLLHKWTVISLSRQQLQVSVCTLGILYSLYHRKMGVVWVTRTNQIASN